MNYFTKTFLISSVILISFNSLSAMHPCLSDRGDYAAINAIALVRDSVVTGSANGTLRFYHFKNGLIAARRIPSHKNIFRIEYTDTTFSAMVNDGYIYTWNFVTGQDLTTSLNPISYVSATRVEVGTKLISTLLGKEAYVYDKRGLKQPMPLVGHTDTINAIAANEARAITGSKDCTIKVWDLDTGACLQTLQGHEASVYFVALVGDVAFSASFDNTLRIWDINKGKCLGMVDCHGDLVRSVAKNDKLIAAGFDNGIFRVWDKVIKP